MARNKGISGKTHTKQQLDDYANQHTPNNKAYKAKITKGKGRLDYVVDLDWMCYSKGLYEFD